MNVLVTGHLGFIGRNVKAKLEASGHTVIGMDIKNGYIEDVTNDYNVDRIFWHNDIEAVIHLAALPGVRWSVAHPKQVYKTNVQGTMNIMSACHTYGVNICILASTSSLYEGSTMPYNESFGGGVLLSPYAASKFAAEGILQTYHNLYGMNTVILRYFTVYGEDGRPDMAPRIFADAICNGRPFSVYGDGSQARDFTYIDDIVSGTIKALDLTGCETINLGNNSPHTLLDLIGRIEEYSGEKARPVFEPAQPGDMTVTYADISKAGRLLNWTPKITFEDGVKRLTAWHMGRC